MQYMFSLTNEFWGLDAFNIYLNFTIIATELKWMFLLLLQTICLLKVSVAVTNSLKFLISMAPQLQSIISRP